MKNFGRYVIGILMLTVGLVVPSAGAADEVGSAPANRSPQPSVHSAGQFIGLKVLDSQGERLGRVQDILLDLEGGRIAFAVVSAGGLFGIGDANYIIPWKALTTDHEKNLVILDLSKEKLAEAPKRQVDMDDEEFYGQLHRFFGVSPYWEDAAKEKEPPRGQEKVERGSGEQN